MLYDADFGRALLTLLFGKHGTSFVVDDGIFVDKLVGKSVHLHEYLVNQTFDVF